MLVLLVELMGLSLIYGLCSINAFRGGLMRVIDWIVCVVSESFLLIVILAVF